MLRRLMIVIAGWCLVAGSSPTTAWAAYSITIGSPTNNDTFSSLGTIGAFGASDWGFFDDDPSGVMLRVYDAAGRGGAIWRESIGDLNLSTGDWTAGSQAPMGPLNPPALSFAVKVYLTQGSGWIADAVVTPTVAVAPDQGS